MQAMSCSYYSFQTYVVAPHYNRLSETVIMRGHNIFFVEKEEKVSLNYPQYPLLSEALIMGLLFLFSHIKHTL